MSAAALVRVPHHMVEGSDRSVAQGCTNMSWRICFHAFSTTLFYEGLLMHICGKSYALPATMADSQAVHFFV